MDELERLESVLQAFSNEFTQCCIDSSSIIYLIKAGVFWSLAACVKLVTVSTVTDETGWKELPIEVREPAFSEKGGEKASEHLVEFPQKLSETDVQLLQLARQLNIPIITEDKLIMTTAESLSIPYYNSLIMLNYLVFVRRVSGDDYLQHLGHLLDTARYSESVIRFGDSLHEKIIC